ncbi:MAG TPA: 23S rRNA (guanosine(2251)-2'-O)-methyltransferase RlmB [Candidatus Paceibacterota bacterium]|nr:23S rRNA (guanosine(2251)-2'-O)-methyltransferase RlmB [Candidatus Paceibacterota bacterium]
MPNENTYIYGKHPVEELLAADPSRIQKIFIKKESSKGFDLINNLASQNKIPVSFLPGPRIKEFAGEDAVSQGVVALIGEVPFLDLEEFLASLDLKANPAVFLLDEIEDPQNVGAIIRSAAAFGFAGVVFGKHRQAPITSVVFKVSAGAAAKIPLVRVVNLNNALEKLKKAGFWTIALDQNAKNNIWQVDFEMPLCFILGGEAKGVREKTLEKADFTYRIPMERGIESLNVSASAAIVASELARRKK